MDKWDNFTIVLQDNQEHKFLNNIYIEKDLTENEYKEMKNIILDVAIEWKENNPFEH